MPTAGPIRQTALAILQQGKFAGPVVEEALAVDLSALGPTILNAAVVQRDTDVTFLVDVTGKLTDPSGDDVLLTLEFARSPIGPWTLATLQEVDRRHTPNPITGVPVAAPGVPFNLVWHAFFDLPEGVLTDIHVRITAEDV